MGNGPSVREQLAVSSKETKPEVAYCSTIQVYGLVLLLHCMPVLIPPNSHYSWLDFAVPLCSPCLPRRKDRYRSQVSRALVQGQG